MQTISKAIRLTNQPLVRWIFFSNNTFAIDIAA